MHVTLIFVVKPFYKEASISRSSTVIKLAVVAGSLICATAIGSWLGTAYGERRARVTRQSVREQSEKLLTSRMVGISIGHSFPSFPVWSADGLVAVESVRELLPQGGLLAAVSPSCQSCVDVAVALQSACNSKGGADCPVVLLLQGQESEYLRSVLFEQGITLPVYCDSELSLYHTHKVTSNPAHFALDADGIVRYVGAGLRSADEFSQIIDNVLQLPRSTKQRGGE